MNRRFRDTGQTLWNFRDEILVRCPACDRCAKVVAAERDEDQPVRVHARRRVVCQHCGYANDGGNILSSIRMQDAHDPHYQQPLWLQMSCCGETLWAYNEKHLDFLESYVTAKLRETAPDNTVRNSTLASRLPAWIKSAKNRDDILRCIGRLRDKLSSCSGHTRARPDG